MRKRWTVVPIFLIVVITLALTGLAFAQGAALAQVATPAPEEEAAPPEAAPTAAPAEEAAPTPAPVQEAAPAQEAAPTAAPMQEAMPTAAPAQEAAPAEAPPTTLPTTGIAGDPLAIGLVVVGMVVALGMVSGYAARRKGTSQE